MDNIADTIDKLYNQSSYSEKNGGSIFMTVLILFVFFIAMSYFYVMSKAKPIKDNWVNERCSPAVMPFAGLINKPPGQSAFDFTGENFSYCTNSILQDITGIFLAPINATINIVLGVFSEIAEAIQASRNIINNVRKAFAGISSEITGRILNILIPMQKVVIAIKDMFGKVQGILTASMFTFLGVYDSIMTGFSATFDLMMGIFITITVAIIILLAIFFTIPVGLIGVGLYIPVAIIMITFLVLMSDVMNQTGMSSVPPVPSCFASGTVIKTKNGDRNIESIKVGDELIDGSKVTSTMILSSHNETMYNLNDVIVSGTHKILFNDEPIFVANHPDANKIDCFYEEHIYCLNTSNKFIKISNMIFTDWDELDEMDLMEIKLKCCEIFPDLTIDEFVKSDIHKYIDSGIFGDTLIELEDGNSVKIKDIHVNDILKFGERVLGIVKIDARDIKLFKHNIDDNVIKGAGNLQIFKTDLGIFDNTLEGTIDSEEIIDNKPDFIYQLLTDTHDFNVNGLTIYDYNGAIESFLEEDEYYIIGE